MSNKNETKIQVIENAAEDDVSAGDHITWDHVIKEGDVTVTVRREGVAQRRDIYGHWCTEEGRGLTWGASWGATFTIRRPITKES